jgi:uncharacterized protein YjdB
MIFTFIPPQVNEANAEASLTATVITVPGIGSVSYVADVPANLIHDETGEWYHTHSTDVTTSGEGSGDYRQFSDRSNIVYRVKDYSALPDRSTDGRNTMIEDSTGGLDFNLYGTSKMSFIDFWRNEGLTPSTITTKASNVTDSIEGYYDLGGYDTISRATLSYGLGHSAYAYTNTISGFKTVENYEIPEKVEDFDISKAYAEDNNGDPIPAGPWNLDFIAKGFKTSGYENSGYPAYKAGPATTKTGSGHDSAEMFYLTEEDGGDEELYIVDSYDVTGYGTMPVSVDAVDYVEMAILADLEKPVPVGFTNFVQGGELKNIWDDADAVEGTGDVAQEVVVDEDTGLLKQLNRNGTYGKASPGSSEMDYEIKAGAVSNQYDSKWGDYYDALVKLIVKNEAAGDDDFVATTSRVEYTNFVYNLLGAKYEYYGDVKDIAGVSKKSDVTTLEQLGAKVNLNNPKAAYGTVPNADFWYRPASNNPQIELGFNFDSLRLGGTGQRSDAGGILQQGSARNKAGYYRVTLYALGHDNIELLVYVPARYVELSKTSLSLMKGLTDSTLKANYSFGDEEGPDGREVIWTSSNPKVATVDKTGKVTAVAEGTANITATVKLASTSIPRGQSDPVTTYTEHASNICKVTVAKPTLKLNATKATLYHKGSKNKTTLKATVTGASKTVTWKSSNTKVATVGKTGVVTAKKKGSATITATANGVTAKATITVKNATLTLKASKATIKKGKSYTIRPTATPKATVTYKTSNKKVATVTAKGVVKGKKKGKATITVTANGIKKKFAVTVK